MCCDCKGPQSDFSLLKGVLDEYASQPGSLITILQQAQDIYGYLPKDVMYHIAPSASAQLSPPTWALRTARPPRTACSPWRMLPAWAAALWLPLS